jgi:methylmalonyl-CoA mutase N-terminal domain/subunit
VAAALKKLEADARAKKNVMPDLVECCRAYCTVGEMAGVFRDVYGEMKEPSIF